MKMWSQFYIILIVISAKYVLSNTIRNVKLSELKGNVQGWKERREDGQRSSLSFVFDVTGSMHDDLKQLREGAELILDAIVESPSTQISNFVLVPFGDPAYGPATVTEDQEEFKRALNGLNLFGGGDCPEMALSGIKLALNVSLPMSYVYVFTDASATDHFILSSVLDQIQRKQSQVVFVLTGDCSDRDQPSFQAYHKVAAASSGQVFNLQKTNVHKVLQFVKSSVAGRRVNLGSTTNPAGYNYTQEIPVDRSLGEVTVSVSGSRPRIKVVDPKGKEVTGPPTLVKTLDLDAIMAVNLVNPEPGNWSITVGSEAEHSVKVTGLSDLSFHHGFSVHPPKNVQETSHRPLQGADNYLMIMPTTTHKSVDIKFAEIVTTDGTLLFELPLKPLDYEKPTYLAGPFLPPDTFFYIAVNGIDENGNNLRRIGVTAVQPQMPDVPFLTVTPQMDVRRHDTVVLTCVVESLVPVTVQWYRGNKRLQDKITSLQSTSVEYVINNMGTESEGLYKCVASNVAGFSKALTNVILLAEPPIVTLAPMNVTLPSHGSLEVVCLIHSPDELLSFELDIVTAGKEIVFEEMPVKLNDVYERTYNIDDVTVNDGGKYTCTARNRGGVTSQTSNILIKEPIKATITDYKYISTPLHSSVNMTCRIDGGDAVQWVDPAGIVRTDNGRIGIEQYDSVYMIHDVGLNDEGVWTCLTRRGEEKALDNVTIEVTIVPTVVMNTLESILAGYGEDISISCTVIGKPAPDITWSNGNGVSVKSNVTTTERQYEYRSTISILNATSVSEGTYMCQAENIAGADAGNVTLHTWKKQSVLQLSSDTNVEIYGNTSLVCEVNSHPPSIIRWYHNGTLLKLSSAGHYERNYYNISDMDFGKTGHYMCAASNEYETSYFNVTVGIGGLEVPRIDRTMSTVVVKAGDAVLIPCRILAGKPLPTITWKFNSGNNEYVDLDECSASLNLTDIDVDHNGTYRCLAENAIGVDSYDVAVIVQFPPDIVGAANVSAQPLQVSAGGRVVLRCDATGEPRPLVVWTKHDMPIAYSQNVYLDSEGSVVIDTATEYDMGVYTCVAANALGNARRNFTLVVYAPPSIADPVVDPEIEALEGQLVELPCSARGLPRPDVQWRHNDKTLLPGGRVLIDKDYTLRFVANLTDFGEYKCVAVNTAGEVSQSYYVFVWVIPYVDLPYETVDIQAGRSVTLTCDAVGFPIPVITWGFGDVTLAEDTTRISYNATGYLSIRNTSAEHEGSYVCSAENRAGVAQKYIRLNVNEPPVIISNNTLFVGLSRDDELNIACRVVGKPKPHVAWIRHDQYLDQDSRYKIRQDGTLNIRMLTEDLTGNYTCEAKNSVGRDTKMFTVQVYSAPKRMQSDETDAVIKLVEGTNETLECNIKYSDENTIKWYKEGQFLTAGPLRFPNVTRDNASIYVCVVTNTVGTASSAIHLEVEWAPLLRGTEGSIEVVEGDDYYLMCESDAKPIGQTRWYLDGKLLPNDVSDHVELQNIRRDHAGLYLCVVTNEHGIATRKYSVSVISPPTIRGEKEVQIDFKEGSEASLQCRPKGVPEPAVRWHYNNSDWSINNTSLTCKNMTQKSAGVFQCVASNKAGVATLVYRVSVLSPASVKEIIAFGSNTSTVLDKVHVEEGKYVRVSCNGGGVPRPDVHWIRNGHTIGSNAPDVYYTDLTIASVQKSDEGVYVCVAMNDAGRSERVVHMDVLTIPKIFKNIFADPTTKLEHMDVLQGSAFRLHCHPYGNPIPSIYWFRDGHLLRLYDDTMVTEEFGEVLVAREAIYELGGNYTCVAKNSVGEDRIDYILNVLVPPQSELKDNSSVKVRGKQGLNVNLVCPFQGNPPPRIIWLKHPYTEISTKLFPKIEKVDNNSTMIINNATTSESGKYSCVVTNKVGTLEVTFEVSVERPPVILSNGPSTDGNVESADVRLMRGVIFKCQVDGFPKPNITWYKDTLMLNRNMSNVQMSLGGQVLSLSEVSPRDAGQYICVADNTAGTVHRRYNLRVTVPGEWSKWTRWSLCNTTCGRGVQIRSRVCQFVGEDNYTIVSNITSTESNAGAGVILDKTQCQGPTVHSRLCHMPSCEEEEEQASCLWSEWSRWGECSGTCGEGTQSRSRYCHCSSSDACEGDNAQIRKCPNLPKCKPLNTFVYGPGPSESNQDSYLPDVTFEMQPKSLPPEAQSRIDGDYVHYSTGDKSDVGTRTLGTVGVRTRIDDTEDPEREQCTRGFTMNSITRRCEDVDECLVESNMCHSTQLCENFPGGYRCFCQPGYSSLGPGQRCLDVDECGQELHLCSYACVNMAGGYVCACPRHLRLHDDQHSCINPSMYRPPSSELGLAENIDFRTSSKQDRHRYRQEGSSEDHYDDYVDRLL